MVETRNNEIRLITSDPAQMLWKYTVKPVLKTWKEDFVDEDTKEIVTIERSMVLLDRGVLIDHDVLQSIRFWQEEGSVNEIEVSDQRRMGFEFKNEYMNPYKAAVKTREKKFSLLLYATSLAKAAEVITDYMELNLAEGFFITDIRELDSCVILVDVMKQLTQKDIDKNVGYMKGEEIPKEDEDLEEEPEPDNKEEALKLKFYQINAKIQLVKEGENDEEQSGAFIVQTFSAMRANLIINKYLENRQEERIREAKERNIDMPRKMIFSFIEESKILSVSRFIPKEFSEAYR